MAQIDPDDIETISVLKDASATAVYGVRGANGVISVSYTHLDVYKRQSWEWPDTAKWLGCSD